jgi:dihydroorotate dehydrogenase electron transfer subunit
MIQEQAYVRRNIHLNGPYYRLSLTCTTAYAAAQPGQFIMVKVADQPIPLLRRPFSIHQSRPTPDGHCLAILYKVVGPVTRRLAMLSPEDAIEILGPLGNDFGPAPSHGPVFLVAGGIGVAPLVFLAQWLLDRGLALDDLRVFIGGRSATDILCRPDFEALGVSVTTATDDGSEGYHGLITQALKPALAAGAPRMIYGCGPNPMLKALIALSLAQGIACRISIETLMACGFGACLGCAVQPRHNSSGPFLHACKEGPVFDARDILL